MASAAKALPEIEEVEIAESDVMTALAEASKRQDALQDRNDRLTMLAADLASRLYCVEMAMNIRDVGFLTGVPQRVVGNATKSTYEHVRRRILVDVLGVDDGADT